jgi:hypothetical protein
LCYQIKSGRCQQGSRIVSRFRRTPGAANMCCAVAASTIPIGDAIIVLRHHGPKATAYGVHGATAAVLLATAALLLT